MKSFSFEILLKEVFFLFWFLFFSSLRQSWVSQTMKKIVFFTFFINFRSFCNRVCRFETVFFCFLALLSINTNAIKFTFEISIRNLWKGEKKRKFRCFQYLQIARDSTLSQLLCTPLFCFSVILFCSKHFQWDLNRNFHKKSFIVWWKIFFLFAVLLVLATSKTRKTK